MSTKENYVPWQAAISKIEDYLYLGSVKARYESIIAENNIRRVIRIVTKEEEARKRFLLPSGIIEDVFYLSDEPSSRILPVIEDTIPLIKEAIERKEAILVHCEAGISRSASIVIGYLIRERKMILKEALSFIQKRRPCIWPNGGFMEQLENLK